MTNDHRPTVIRSLGVGTLIGGSGVVLVWLLAGCGSTTVRYSTVADADSPASQTNAPARPASPPLPRAVPVVMAVEAQRSTHSALVAPGISNAVTLMVRSAAPPSIAAAALPQKRGTLSLAWNASPDPSAVGYRLHYGTNSGVYYASANVGNSTASTLAGLDEGTRYFIAATAFDASGAESVPSNEASGVTPIYVSLTTQCWQVSAYGLLGRTNMIQMTTNLTAWETVLTWTGDGVATNAMHTNTVQAWFRVEAMP